MDICVVDDEKELTDIYSDYLRDTHRVRSFNSAEEALAEFDKGYVPKLIISDIKMPKISGLEFIDRLREKNVFSPVVLMSGFADKTHALKAIEKQVSGFLEKPFEPEQLRAVVDKVSHKSLLNEVNEKLLKKYRGLSEYQSELLSCYRERFQTAENILYEANIPLQKERAEVKKFLANVSVENGLENTVEKIFREIKDLNKGLHHIEENI